MGWPREVEKRWQGLVEEALVGMKQWREEHPKATFKEIEAALDERLARVRAKLLEDAAMFSAMVDITTLGTEARPRCPDPKCQQPLESRGQETRSLLSNYNQPIQLTRARTECPSCGTGLFPPR